MEISTINETNEKELSTEQKNKLAQKIANWFKKWDDDRNVQIDTARDIMIETYLKQPARTHENENTTWKSDVKLNGLYNIKRAKKSIIWKEIWANPEQMFDVRGTDSKTEENSKAQKAAIVDSLNKMNIGKQMDNAIDNLYDIGEMIFIVDWIKKTKIVKRQDNIIGFRLLNVVKSLTGSGFTQKPMSEKEIPLFENARVQSISPFMFVFDHGKFKLNDKESWDSTVKIYKRFDSLDNVKNNKIYKLTAEQILDLKGQNADKTSENKNLIDLRDENEYSGEYSILYAHGDFTIDGKLYKNYVAEVLAGKYLIRFEKNPMYINPFVLCALEYDPETKRGISPLKASMYMVKEEEKLVNVAFDAQKLTVNPPLLADEELFTSENTNADGTITYAPGLVIKHKSSYNGGIPTPLTPNVSGVSDLLNLLGQKISDVSSVNANMFGNITSSQRTATELNLADKGASAQSSKELDTIYQDCTIPIIEKVAELLAMFKNGVDYIRLQEKGEAVEYKITNAIRQAQYDYVYEDRNALNDRKNKFEQLYQLASGLAKLPELQGRINWFEIATQGFEMIDLDNTAKFFQEPQEIDKMAEEFKQMPSELQQQLLPMFQQAAQQVMQQYQIKQMQQQAQNQVQMEMYRQLTRQQAQNNILSGGVVE